MSDSQGGKNQGGAAIEPEGPSRIGFGAESAIPSDLLGEFGDIPLAVAVFRVIVDETGERAVDGEYLYVSQLYCEWGGHEPGTLIGRTFAESNDIVDPLWLAVGYRAAILGETVHDIMYSKSWGHWLSFTMAPSSIEGCCVYVAMIADDESRERQEMAVGRDTSDLIIGITNVFNRETSYEAAMNSVLEMISDVLRPDRLLVFERGERTTSCVFEWSAPGVPPQIERMQGLPNERFDTMRKLATRDAPVIESDVDDVKGVDRGIGQQLDREGVERMMAVPLLSDGGPVGYLSANNYALVEGVDTKRVLDTVAGFISARIVNHRLMSRLEKLGTHDSLTGVLNRWGIDAAIEERLAAHPDEPYALVLMDIDDFKVVNDLHGHDVGDAALKKLAQVITQVFSETAIIGRNGGDEFLAMLFDEAYESAESLVKELVNADLACEHNGERYGLSMSVGFAEYPGQACSLQDTYTKADAALYAVKLAGKSGYRRYSSKYDDQDRSQFGFAPRDIAENMPGAVLVYKADTNGEILFANDELVQLLDCESYADCMEFTGGEFGNAVHPDDKVRVNEELAFQARSLGVGEKGFVDCRIVTKTGRIRHIEYNGRLVVSDDTGEMFYALIVDCDERAGK